VAVPSPWGLPTEDLAAAAAAARDDLAALRGTRILVTGGTGFLGSWLTATLAWASQRAQMGWEILVLSRDPSRVPLKGLAGIRLLAGDVTTLAQRHDLGHLDAVIHGAASSSAPYGHGDGEPRAMAATIVDGTRQVLEVAARSKARVLLLSSGAVYGPLQAPVDESARSGPDPMEPRSAYGEAKRLAETLCASTSAAGDATCVIGRLFAFVGPRIPLEAHYAAGNFLASALERRPLVIEGDGRPWRSYLYSGELPHWCLRLLVSGSPGRAYNVGSPKAVSIYQLAEACRRASGADLAIEVRSPPGEGPAPCYVPITRRAELELGLTPTVGLDEALERTLAWLGGRSGAIR